MTYYIIRIAVNPNFKLTRPVSAYRDEDIAYWKALSILRKGIKHVIIEAITLKAFGLAQSEKRKISVT